MNGKREGSLPVIDTTNWFVSDTFSNTKTTISSNSNYEADLVVPKKTGYRLIGIGGFELGHESGTRYFYFTMYRAAIEIGSTEDTIHVGLRNSYSSSGAAHEIIFKLIYIREDWT